MEQVTKTGQRRNRSNELTRRPTLTGKSQCCTNEHKNRYILQWKAVLGAKSAFQTGFHWEISFLCELLPVTGTLDIFFLWKGIFPAETVFCQDFPCKTGFRRDCVAKAGSRRYFSAKAGSHKDFLRKQLSAKIFCENRFSQRFSEKTGFHPSVFF